jgi:hypothetical protein
MLIGANTKPPPPPPYSLLKFHVIVFEKFQELVNDSNSRHARPLNHDVLSLHARDASL